MVIPFIYTHGSGINGGIGAAIVNTWSNTTQHQYLGKETEYNVYAAKLYAIYLGLENIKETCQSSMVSQIHHIYRQPSSDSSRQETRPTIWAIHHLQYPGQCR
jgi:hypothetical protein